MNEGCFVLQFDIYSDLGLRNHPEADHCPLAPEAGRVCVLMSSA